MADPASSALPGSTFASSRSAPNASADYPPIWRAIQALVLFIFVYLLYFADAQLITLLVSPIEQSYGINDTRFSLLAAAPPVIAILVIGLPIATLVDRWNRRNLLAAAALIWTAMNISCAFASGFWMLVALKIGVAIGGVWYYPTVISLLSDFFAPRHRTLAFTLLQLCGTSGVGIAVMFSGGAIELAHRMSDIEFAGARSIAWWQWAFILVSVPAPLGIALLLNQGTAASSGARFLGSAFETAALPSTPLVSLPGGDPWNGCGQHPGFRRALVVTRIFCPHLLPKPG